MRKKNTLLILLFAFCYSCHKIKESQSKSIISNGDYQINYIDYWEKTGKTGEFFPRTIIKIDTIQALGSSLFFSADHILIEKIILIDHYRAIKINYKRDGSEHIKICTYFLRRNHPVNMNYSIVCTNCKELGIEFSGIILAPKHITYQ